MGEATVKTSQWRLVEVGRVALFSKGPQINKLAVIVEIIDHKRVLVENPNENPTHNVQRHSARLVDMTLTHIVIPKLPRAAGTGTVRKQWEKADVDGEWAKSTWAKRRENGLKRRQLGDFDRFKICRLKKQQRFEVRKEMAKLRASAKA